MGCGMIWRVTIVLVLAVLGVVTNSASGAVVFYSVTQAQTGLDYYNPGNPIGQYGSAQGTTSATLDFSAPGPLSGTFDFSGAASAAVGSLKVRAATTLTGYSPGSYAKISWPDGDLLPISGWAAAVTRDDVVISGALTTYDVRFTYSLSGSAVTGLAGFYPYLMSVVRFEQGTSSQVGYQQFVSPSGSLDTVVTIDVLDVPSNTVLGLSQTLEVDLIAYDSYYITDINPLDNNDFDPSHILGQGSLIFDPTYSVSYSLDASHTLLLQDVSIFDQDGQIAGGASLRSLNGVTYPGQTAASVPEPTSWVLVSALFLIIGVVGFRRNVANEGATGLV